MESLWDPLKNVASDHVQDDSLPDCSIAAVVEWLMAYAIVFLLVSFFGWCKQAGFG